MEQIDYIIIIGGLIGAIVLGSIFYSAHMDEVYELETMNCSDLKHHQQYYLGEANDERPDSWTSRYDEYKSQSEDYRKEFLLRCDEPKLVEVTEAELTFEEKLQIDYKYENSQKECSKLEFDIDYYNKHLKTTNPDSQLNNDYERYQWKLDYAVEEHDTRCN